MLYDLYNQMTVFEKMRNKRLPDYYDTMYQDGYTPEEIREALHNTMIRENYQRKIRQEEVKKQDNAMDVNFNVEVKKK